MKNKKSELESNKKFINVKTASLMPKTPLFHAKKIAASMAKSKIVVNPEFVHRPVTSRRRPDLLDTARRLIETSDTFSKQVVRGSDIFVPSSGRADNSLYFSPEACVMLDRNAGPRTGALRFWRYLALVMRDDSWSIFDYEGNLIDPRDLWLYGTTVLDFEYPGLDYSIYIKDTRLIELITTPDFLTRAWSEYIKHKIGPGKNISSKNVVLHINLSDPCYVKDHTDPSYGYACQICIGHEDSLPGRKKTDDKSIVKSYIKHAGAVRKRKIKLDD